MSKRYQFRTLGESLEILEKTIESTSEISIREIFTILSGRGRPLFLILLSLPFCQPIQIPGLSVPFGIVIAFIGLRMVLGKGIWLPKRFLQITVHTQTLKKIVNKTKGLIKKVKPWTHARLDWVCNSLIMKIVNGLIIVVLGLFLALPLVIPASNLIAAWLILLLAFGFLEDDGLLVLIAESLILLIVMICIVVVTKVF